MTKYTTRKNTINRLALTLLCTAFSTIISPTPGVAERPVPRDLDPGLSARSAGTTRASECFETWFEAPGIFAIEAIASAGATWEPRLELPATGVERLASGVSAGILFVPSAGGQTFCVRAQDPRHSPGAYKIVTAFVEMPGSGPASPEPRPGTRSIVEPCPENPAVGEDPCELESVPEPIAGIEDPCEPLPPTTAEDPCEREPVPEPARARLGTTARDLCARRDDHAELALCATALRFAEERAGRLEAPWGDDVDTFTFTLSEVRTVEFSSTGDIDTFATLFDAGGHRLATDDDSGEGENFRLVKTLAPGRYWLRVAGTGGAEGVYTVRWTDAPQR